MIVWNEYKQDLSSSIVDALFNVIFAKHTLENTEVAIKNGQFRETGKIDKADDTSRTDLPVQFLGRDSMCFIVC
jgi:hypothetical protein